MTGSAGRRAWQAAMTDMIRGAAPLDGSRFTGSATLTAEEQIGIYAEQYRLRLWDAFVDEVPGWHALAGDEAEDVVWSWFLAHPPSTWSLGTVADGFADWLAARGASDVQVDMARVDHAVMRGFVAADARVPRPEELGAGLLLGLQPHVTLLALRHPVHRARTVWSETGELPAIDASGGSSEGHRIAVYRHDRGMKHTECEAGAFAALQTFAAAARVEDAVAAAVAADPGAPARLGAWFKGFAERGLLRVVG